MNSYTVKEILDQKIWEKFVQNVAPATFLQSWNWGEHYKSDHTIWRVGIYDQGQKLIGVALWIVVRAKRGDFLLCPHGPILAASDVSQGVLSQLTKSAEAFARKHHCDFVRVAPILVDSATIRQWFRELGFRPAPIHIHPELSWILDITPSASDLLQAMRKTTRYMIRKAEKSQVQIRTTPDISAVDEFWPIYKATYQRQQFAPFSLEYLRNEFQTFAKDGQALMFFADIDGQPVSAAMIIFYGNSAFYHQSGSLRLPNDVGASYLLQWHVIQEAKRRGCRFYNFWGIAPQHRVKHPWAGLSLFKQGFGGTAEAYIPTQDLPLTAKYWFNYIVERLRKYRRGL
ncbi:MAG: peptidoglycan bridge formation glycyltransferase FemA/FemB family protein [Patescibacteria group bacterium]|nr:peptidoglycan bridge formation glycyltransferase FemA/FemB family protein [Patescibacteria group bacterium]